MCGGGGSIARGRLIFARKVVYWCRCKGRTSAMRKGRAGLLNGIRTENGTGLVGWYMAGERRESLLDGTDGGTAWDLPDGIQPENVAGLAGRYIAGERRGALRTVYGWASGAGFGSAAPEGFAQPRPSGNASLPDYFFSGSLRDRDDGGFQAGKRNSRASAPFRFQTFRPPSSRSAGGGLQSPQTPSLGTLVRGTCIVAPYGRSLQFPMLRLASSPTGRARLRSPRPLPRFAPV